ncbi:MAG TPA: Ca2+-dependent phosphoinositide-specific phospholipase C [Candidatus Binatia bacterium]|nr:Ca2+-dependent phosphoinositide-specific phospholipase C [Candidatus Binatia bacterium]
MRAARPKDRRSSFAAAARWAVAISLIAALAAGCGDRAVGGAGDESDPAASAIAYDQAWQIATHNSYWVDRATPNDLLASGVGERLLDQMLLDGVRTLEIDIHADPARPGGFRVFHTVPGNSVCATIEDCLAALRAFHHALPRHEVVTIVLELKGILEPTFDARHSPADLDRAITGELGALLYRPSDALARCSQRGVAAGAPLADCVAAAGWPSLADLRGRFIVTILGNWDDIGDAQATRDWVDYATAAPIADRVAFPMASSWKLDRSALTPRLQALVSQDDLDRAFAETVFLQIEDLADPHIDPFLARRGVIRVDGAFTADDQAARIARGMQLLQTDFPWVTADGAGPAEALRALAPAALADRALREPGARVFLDAPPGADDGAVAFAYRDAGEGPTSWETTVSSRLGAAGCLRAADAVVDPVRWIEVCREKVGPTGPLAETVAIRVARCDHGDCAVDFYPGSIAGTGRPGDAIALDVAPSGRGACLTVRSTDLFELDGEGRWVEVQTSCFDAPLRFQGIARRDAEGDRSRSPALFTATRLRARGGAARELAADDFDAVSVVPANDASESAALLRAATPSAPPG